MAAPNRGEVWSVSFDPTRGHEQGGTRPALVVSVDLFNEGPADLVVVLPMTSRAKGIPFHVRIDPPEAGTVHISYVKCEDIRSVSRERLGRLWGRVNAQTLIQVEDRLRVLLDL